MTDVNNLNEAQTAEYHRRCKRIGLPPDSRPAWEDDELVNSLKRLAIVTEITTGRRYEYDPIAKSYGETKPAPVWLVISRE